MIKARKEKELQDKLKVFISNYELNESLSQFIDKNDKVYENLASLQNDFADSLNKLHGPFYKLNFKPGNKWIKVTCHFCALKLRFTYKAKLGVCNIIFVDKK